MRMETRRQETGADAGEFLVGRDFSRNPLEGRSAVSCFYTVATVLVHIAMTMFVLFLSFTQVYANVRVFGWSGFGALLLIAPLVSLGYIWFNLKVHSPWTLRNRVERAKHPRRGCADQDADCNPIQT